MTSFSGTVVLVATIMEGAVSVSQLKMASLKLIRSMIIVPIGRFQLVRCSISQVTAQPAHLKLYFVRVESIVI